MPLLRTILRWADCIWVCFVYLVRKGHVQHGFKPMYVLSVVKYPIMTRYAICVHDLIVYSHTFKLIVFFLSSFVHHRQSESKTSSHCLWAKKKVTPFTNRWPVPVGGEAYWAAASWNFNQLLKDHLEEPQKKKKQINREYTLLIAAHLDTTVVLDEVS